MTKDQRQQLENLHRYVEWLSPEAYANQLAKTEDPQAVFALIRRGDTTGVACALKNGLPIDLKDRNGMTMLHHAAGHDARLITAVLSEKANAAPWTRDRYGRLPLDVARDCGHQMLGDSLERITYPTLFRDEKDGPVPPEVIERFAKQREQLSLPDTRPPYAHEVEFRPALSLNRNLAREERYR